MNLDLERLVSRRAAEDGVYRRALLANPQLALREYHGVELAEGVTLRVVEQGQREVVLRIPPLVVPEPQVVEVDDVDDAGGFYASGCLASTCSATCNGCVDADTETLTA